MRLARAWLATMAVLGCGLTSASAEERPKVVILGFDGADARLVERWMDEGKLPNLSKLRVEGAYAPLEPTNPPQTPVSWSTFATGFNPGRTEIFDFLQRREGQYVPDLALATPGKVPLLLGRRCSLTRAPLATCPWQRHSLWYRL